MKVKCKNCGKIFDAENYSCLCPHCGTWYIPVDQFDIQSVDYNNDNWSWTQDATQTSVQPDTPDSVKPELQRDTPSDVQKKIHESQENRDARKNSRNKYLWAIHSSKKDPICGLSHMGSDLLWDICQSCS